MTTFQQGKHALKLWTVGTPNGYKASIFLEELKAAYGLEYDFQGLSFKDADQKKEEFLNINPNGRIPALTDYSLTPPLHIFESGSIELYLTEHYDPKHLFSFTDPREKSESLSWLIFSQSGVGPMQGQANHFTRYAPEKIEYGMKRYQDETRRLYSVLEDRLAGKREQNGDSGEREYIIGAGKGKYSIVDINLWPWVRVHAWAGLENIDEFPHLQAWIDRVGSRPAVKAGLDVPEKNDSNAKLSKEEQEKKAEEARAWIFKK